NAHIGKNVPTAKLKEFDAVILTGGSTVSRDLPIPGRELQGVHFAMEFLPLQNRRNAGATIAEEAFISAKGKDVVILGGGDTGSDCLGTAHRQGARSVTQFELLPEPPRLRRPTNPWPQWPTILRTSTSHEEGGERDYSILTKSFSGTNGRVERLHAVRL